MVHVHYLCPMKHVYILLLSIVAFGLSAQSLSEFHISQRTPDGTSVVQASTAYPDNAMILVYSALPNLSFRSSVGAVNQQRYNARANRYEILISPQKQIVFVSAQNFIEQRLALINPSPKEVFYYEVEPRSGQDELAVYFDVTPKDANLFIDNIPHPINTTTRAPEGVVSLRLEREGYRAIEQSLVITGEQVKYDFVMEEVDVVPIQIESNVPEATIVIDGKERGQTDFFNRRNMFLFPGVYNIEVRKSGYLSQIQTVEIYEDRDNNVLFTLKKNTGNVEFVLSPPDAQIRVNRELVSGDDIIELAPGTYRIDISASGYRSASQTLTVALGQTQLIRKQLEQISGSLQATVSPSVADVVLKNMQGQVVERWEGIKLLNNIPVGEYVMEISAPSFQTVNHKLEVEDGKRTIVDVALQQQIAVSNAAAEQTAARDFTNLFQLSVMPSNINNPHFLYNNHYGLRYTSFSKNADADVEGLFVELSSTLNFSSADYQMDAFGRISDLNVDDIIYIHDEESKHQLRSAMFGFGYSFYAIKNVYLSAGLGFLTYDLQYEASVLTPGENSVSSDVTIAKGARMGEEWNIYYSGGVQFQFERLYIGTNVFHASNTPVGLTVQLLMGFAF